MDRLFWCFPSCHNHPLDRARCYSSRACVNYIGFMCVCKFKLEMCVYRYIWYVDVFVFSCWILWLLMKLPGFTGVYVSIASMTRRLIKFQVLSTWGLNIFFARRTESCLAVIDSLALVMAVETSCRHKCKEASDRNILLSARHLLVPLQCWVSS